MSILACCGTLKTLVQDLKLLEACKGLLLHPSTPIANQTTRKQCSRTLRSTSSLFASKRAPCHFYIRGDATSAVRDIASGYCSRILAGHVDSRPFGKLVRQCPDSTCHDSDETGHALINPYLCRIIHAADGAQLVVESHR